IFNRWSSISGLTYVFEPNDDGATINGTGGDPVGLLGVRPDLRLGGKPLDGDFNVLAYNYFPNSGDQVLDTNDSFFTDTSGGSLRLRNTLAHEHGHGHGQSHVQTNNAAFLMQPILSLAYDGPQFHDILIAQRGYGDVLEKYNAGANNDVAAR